MIYNIFSLKFKVKGLKPIVFLTFYFLFFILPGFTQDNSEIVETRGNGKVKLVKYANGEWLLLVGGEPYLVKGVTYDPLRVGEKLSASNLWMNYDFNNNGINDVAYEAWVDENRNNKRDKEEKVVGDFHLMKEMGVNTIRIYHPTNVKKEILRDLYEKFGIRVIMGNFLGAYCWGSTADWEDGTDYTNPRQLENMLDDVKQMVLEYKDEPYIIAWLLGNENDMKGSYENSTFNNTNARFYPEDFAKFINKVASFIHLLDPDHPVGVCNGSFVMLPFYKEHAQEIDFLGFNSYSGPYGLSSVFRMAKFYLDRPVLITEFGSDSYDQRNKKRDEDSQVFYHKKSWQNIVENYRDGAKNSMGGIVHNWLDTWGYCGSSKTQDTNIGAWQGAAAKDGWFNDEWLGICSQGNGKSSPFLRQLKKVYYFYRKEWE